MLLTGLAGVTVPMPATSEADQDLTCAAMDTVATLSTPGDSQHAKVTIGSFKVATYFILIFYLTGFYCQIKISNLIGVFKVAIYFYLIDYLL
jgi:hypothetical protein